MKTLSIALLFAAGLSAQVPEIAFDSTPNLLKLPAGQNLGEVPGVATDSKGHIIVLTRSGDMYATTGTSRTFTHGGVQLLEFDQNGRYLKEMGQGLYGFLYAQQVRIDPQDNIWVVDRGSSLVIKFDPNGNVIWPMGRKPESINVGPPPTGAAVAAGRGGPPGVGTPGDLFQSALRRRLEFRWRNLRRRWLRQCPRRQVRQNGPLHQSLGPPRFGRWRI